jgi:hypothetical protein
MKIVTRLFIAVLSGLLTLPAMATDRDVDAVFSPAMLVMKSKAPALVTVHANVPILAVEDLDSVCLNIGGTTLYPEKIFADLCGDLVAKFDADAVKEAVKLALSVNNKAKTAVVQFALGVDDYALQGSFRVKVK